MSVDVDDVYPSLLIFKLVTDGLPDASGSLAASVPPRAIANAFMSIDVDDVYPWFSIDLAPPLAPPSLSITHVHFPVRDRSIHPSNDK